MAKIKKLKNKISFIDENVLYVEGKVEYWTLTNQLRFIEDQTPIGTEEVVFSHNVLQQAWISNKGNTKWENVPIENES